MLRWVGYGANLTAYFGIDITWMKPGLVLLAKLTVNLFSLKT
jgi:hypothetical protein